jgi:predicted  nucleic acid-binding Zn-ribbon protein
MLKEQDIKNIELLERVKKLETTDYLKIIDKLEEINKHTQNKLIELKYVENKYISSIDSILIRLDEIENKIRSIRNENSVISQYNFLRNHIKYLS